MGERYRPGDREEKLGPVPEGGFKPDDPKVIAWEAAHGHDLRLECLPEFGCHLSDPISQIVQQSPRQDSLRDQLRDLCRAAVKLGCFAATDWIGKVISDD